MRGWKAESPVCIAAPGSVVPVRNNEKPCPSCLTGRVFFCAVAIGLQKVSLKL